MPPEASATIAAALEGPPAGRGFASPSPRDSETASCAAQPPPPLDLSIVIVSWNTRHVVRECLESVFANLGSLSAEVIVIDNASSDGSAELIAGAFPQVRLVANHINRGFAAANNQGLRVAKGRYVLLLNPDTVVLPDALQRTLDHAESHPTAGIIGCQVWESPQSVQRTCFRFPSPLNTLLWVTGASAWLSRSRIAGRAAYGPWQRESERDVDVVSGMFMLVRREAIDEVGLMDESFFVFAEEADWCRRFRNAGWRCVFAPVGRILHVNGGSQSTEQAAVKMYVEMQKSVLLFHRKHLGLISWATAKLLFSLSMVARTLWWRLWAALRIGRLSGQKARKSQAAARFHLTGAEPGW
ncbi:MAG: glycosyltransferase family 2 protein [Planctomycetota bacterium]|jgi:GT2 family glycosyltransferase